MNKIYTTLLLFTCCNLSFGQISLTSSMAPAANTMFLFYDANVPSPPFTFSKSGTINTWDFVAITITPGQVDSVFYLAPSDYPIAATYFPSATHATYEAGDAGVTMISVDANGGSYLGVIDDPLGTGTMMPLVAQPAGLTMTFPWTYGSSTSVNTFIEIYASGASIGQPAIDSVHFKSTAIINSDVIASGDIILPSGTMSALLERRIHTSMDSSWMKSALSGGMWITAVAPALSTDSAFYWYSDQSLQPYAHALFDETGVMHDVNYYMSQVSTDISNIHSAKTLNVFPNPTHDFLGVKGLDLPAASEWVVYNIEGQKVLSGKTDLNLLDVQKLNQGTYLLHFITSAGQTHELKFVKY